MNYNLLHTDPPKTKTLAALKDLWRFMAGEKRRLLIALIAILITSGLNLLAPWLVGHTIDTYIAEGQYRGVLVFSGILLALYLCTLVTQYVQTQLMGGVGQRVLYQLRNAVFTKLQELPAAFFNQNKAGDLISRINNDTDKINQFFSQSLMQFVGGIFMMTGAGIFLLVIHAELGAATLLPAVMILIFTKIASPLVKRRSARSMQSTGNMSAEIQESLSNFKAIIAFNRRDYFRSKFEQVNKQNYAAAISSGVANSVFMPVFTFFSGMAQLVVLAFGIYLISLHHFTIGLLISYLAYANNFYMPLRQLAVLWANFQTAMAGWDRISGILGLETDLVVSGSRTEKSSPFIMQFRDVSFRYPDGKEVLHHISFDLEKGKTYALVGPTGGGKTTTASLIARLYDPSEGAVLLDGIDIRSYPHAERTRRIGFILQEPFLFTGNLRDNILYGNETYYDHTNAQLTDVIREAGLDDLLERFPEGLDTPVQATGESISLGQKQLIAFIRAVLRRPDLLVLDEATANIDTITEKLLDDILKKLPEHTTRVIIAHRLNTIANADEIFFVNAGEVIHAGSLDHAMKMLLHEKRES